MAWAGRAAAAAELKMDKRKKRPGAAAPRDERVEAYMPRQVQGKSSWSVQGESQTNSGSPKTAPPEREKAVESEEYVSPKTGSPEREKAGESEEYVSPKTGSSQSSHKYGYPS
ncbi:hypothetical protein KUCAC02_021015 [Chaenocephalus aceratus]|uniref:Uncharacterized protein n=1 Tax=Chaenocephalus aceratus TaxID=36190 RepID=A0ACB9XGD0_CHAAC|nr:hypothetical protein KUCAC02_021015 [Chaenocephalus aceratus]